MAKKNKPEPFNPNPDNKDFHVHKEGDKIYVSSGAVTINQPSKFKSDTKIVNEAVFDTSSDQYGDGPNGIVYLDTKTLITKFKRFGMGANLSDTDLPIQTIGIVEKFGKTEKKTRK